MYKDIRVKSKYIGEKQKRGQMEDGQGDIKCQGMVTQYERERERESEREKVSERAPGRA